MDNMSNIYLVIHKIASLPGFWLCLMLCPVSALLPDLVYKVFARSYCPTDHDIVQVISTSTGICTLRMLTCQLRAHTDICRIAGTVMGDYCCLPMSMGLVWVA